MREVQHPKVPPGDFPRPDTLADSAYVVVDVETSGFEPEEGAEVIEVAAVRFQAGEPLDKFASLVRPNRPIPPSASAVHFLTTKMVLGAPPAAAVMAALDDFVKADEIVVAHNARFDRKFLPVLQPRTWCCSYRFARHLWSEAPEYKNQTLRYWLGLDASFLADVGAHRAAGTDRPPGRGLDRVDDANAFEPRFCGDPGDEEHGSQGHRRRRPPATEQVGESDVLPVGCICMRSQPLREHVRFGEDIVEQQLPAAVAHVHGARKRMDPPAAVHEAALIAVEVQTRTRTGEGRRRFPDVGIGHDRRSAGGGAHGGRMQGDDAVVPVGKKRRQRNGVGEERGAVRGKWSVRPPICCSAGRPEERPENVVMHGKGLALGDARRSFQIRITGGKRLGSRCIAEVDAARHPGDGEAHRTGDADRVAFARRRIDRDQICRVDQHRASVSRTIAAVATGSPAVNEKAGTPEKYSVKRARASSECGRAPNCRERAMPARAGESG